LARWRARSTSAVRASGLPAAASPNTRGTRVRMVMPGTLRSLEPLV
jgi:hypothetical protein